MVLSLLCCSVIREIRLSVKALHLVASSVTPCSVFWRKSLFTSRIWSWSSF
jgi:hypothetical protein